MSRRGAELSRGVPGEEEAAYARARVLVSVAGAGLAGVSSYLLYVLAGPLGKESVKER